MWPSLKISINTTQHGTVRLSRFSSTGQLKTPDCFLSLSLRMVHSPTCCREGSGNLQADQTERLMSLDEKFLSQHKWPSRRMQDKHYSIAIIYAGIWQGLAKAVVYWVSYIARTTLNPTSSSAVAKRLRDDSCLSVVSFNSTKRQLSAIFCYTLALDLPLRKLNNVLFFSLRRIHWCVAFCAINRLAPWQSVIHHWTDHRQLIPLATAGIGRQSCW